MEACRTPIQTGDIIGRPCRDCGHANILHPSPLANPTLEACIICELVILKKEWSE